MELFRARRRLSAEVERQKDQLLRQTRELADMSMGMVEALAAAIEFRSDESGSHVRRIRDMTRHILLDVYKRQLYDASLAPDEVILCFRDVDEEKRRELQHNEILQEALDAAVEGTKAKSEFFSRM